MSATQQAFRLTMAGPEGDTRELIYQPHLSDLRWADNGKPVVAPEGDRSWVTAARVNGAKKPGRKSTAIRHLKIQLGLKCNYACSYCLQRFQPEHDEGGAEDVLHFFERLPRHFDGGSDGKGQGVRIEFWGGEPFLYFKSKLRLLGLTLKSAYPNARFAIVTNGSVLSTEILDWIEAIGCSIALSHDGPGQTQRGPDPLDDEAKRGWILRLHDRLAPRGLFSFNVTLTASNHDLSAIHAWFAERLEGRVPPLNIEGMALPYTDEGFASTIVEPQAQRAAMTSIMKTIVNGPGLTFPSLRSKLDDFLGSLRTRRPSSALGQKCGMDRADSLAVTLTGDVLTCQNVSPTATAPNGEPHHLGTLDALADVRLTSATHWSHRRECSNCPVLQLCQGSCMFLQGKAWSAACDSEFTYNMGIFMAALYLLTGKAPVAIDGPIVRPGHAHAPL
jgi:uncharacterized protein